MSDPDQSSGVDVIFGRYNFVLVKTGSKLVPNPRRAYYYAGVNFSYTYCARRCPT